MNEIDLLNRVIHILMSTLEEVYDLKQMIWETYKNDRH